MAENHLHFGDNLRILREYVPTETVDLVYLDPPFNSNRNYSVIFNRHDQRELNSAQIEAFEDTWHWTSATEEQYMEFIQAAPGNTADALVAFRTLLGENDAMAYLVNMAPRLLELHRVLKSTGTLYLHCDPTMSHYLKVLLDPIFGVEHFLSEIIWKRTSAHNRASRFGPVHDVILSYSKSNSWTWNKQYIEYNDAYVESNYRNIEATTDRRYSTADLTSNNPGSRYIWNGMPPPGNRYWGVSFDTMQEYDNAGRLHYTKNGLPRLKNYLDEMPGQIPQDVWSDIAPVGARALERLGYQTQKPRDLLERIITASTNDGDVVLDPFCGCGTTIDAAVRMNRRWVGIDITYISIDLIRKRLQHTYDDNIADTFDVTGIPEDVASAQAMFDNSPFEFERWAVSLVRAEPNKKQVGDRGIDGIARFMLPDKQVGKILVSVKGGKTLTPSMVRDLAGTVRTQQAQMGILVTLVEPTRGVQEAVDHGGVWVHPANGDSFPVLQHFTVEQLLRGVQPDLPPTMYKPYIQAKRQTPESTQEAIF